MDKPVILMPEDVQRLKGENAQSNNITAAKMVADIVKTTLGPKGMDKMLVSPNDDIIVTNDGVTILNEMQIKHPAAKMMSKIAKTQESEIGDGTTSAVMIAGKLLENAKKLLNMKIHPTTIVKGYKLASSKSQEILKEISFKITSDKEEMLKQIAMTAMTGKGAENSKEILSEIIVKAASNVEDIQIEKVIGQSVKDSELINGTVFKKNKISHDMPDKVENPKIALVDVPLETMRFERETNLSSSSPEQLQNFLSKEEEKILGFINNLKEKGVNVLLCQKGIDDFTQSILSKNEMYACSRVAKEDMEKISKATGAKILSNIKEFSSAEIGNAKTLENIKCGEEKLTLIKGCENPKSVSILLRGGTEHVLDEIERAVEDGIGDVFHVLKSGLIVLGGGATEIEISKRLRKFAQSLNGREQLAVEEFANALEFIPTTLAENAGLDPIDILIKLKSLHDSGKITTGLNLFNNKVEDVLESKIIEPYDIKRQAIDSASEVATMILRIDDVIASEPDKRGNMKNTGEMPGYMKGFY